MNLVRRIVTVVLIIGCLAGVALVVVDTWRRGNPTADVAPIANSSTSTTTGGGTTVSTFPVSSSKNPFQGLVQLPPTATTQPK